MAAANPYTEFLTGLDSLLYVELPDPDGFRRRMIVLCSIAIYGMIVSLAYGIVIIFQYEMPHSARSSPTSSADSTHVGFGTSSTPSTDTNRKLWLFRRVDGYICMNSHVLLPTLGFIACAFMLVYTYLHYLVMRYHEQLGPATGFRPFAWVPMVMQGVLLTMAAVQAYTVVVQRSAPGRQRMSDTRGERGFSWLRRRLTRIPGPRLFNTLFFVLTFVVLASMLATDIAFSVSWRSLWKAFVSLRSMLLKTEDEWSPTDPFDVAMLLKINELRGVVVERRARSSPIIRSVILVLIINSLIMAILNIGLGALYLLVRKQIRQSSSLQSRSMFNYQMFPTPVQGKEDTLGVPTFRSPFHVDPRANVPSASADTVLVQLPSSATDEKSLVYEQTPTVGRRLSILATSFASPRARQDAATRRQSAVTFGNAHASHLMDLAASDSLSDLKRAEMELVIIFLCVGSLALMFAGFNVWNYMWSYARPPDVVKWSDNEVSYFFVDWAYCILYSTATTGLVINALIAIRRRKLARRRASSTATLGLRRESNMWAAGMRRHSAAVDARERFGSAGAVRVQVESTTEVDHDIESSPSLPPSPFGRRPAASFSNEMWAQPLKEVGEP